MIRIFSNCILLLSVFFLPPYLIFIFILALIFVFDTFAESILWAFILDILYGGGGFWGIHVHYLFTLFTAIFFLCSFQLKSMLKFYLAA